MQDLEAVFGEQGPLAQRIENYRPRDVQLAMAKAIQRVLEGGGRLIAEAGTGTGKTFAYLVPALLSGKRIVVSTATKNLQDQLFYQDIPILREALAVPFRAALLKGRANYLCPYRLDNAIDAGFGFNPEQVDAISRIKAWAGRTRSGDIAEFSEIPENSVVWPAVTSTVDNCLGQECPKLEQCFLLRARRTGMEAEILVINHHLLCADWLLRDGGFGELLPQADAVIVDEAHQLAATAGQFLGLSLSSRQLQGLIEDSLIELQKDAADMDQLAETAEALGRAVTAMRTAFGETAGQRGALSALLGQTAFQAGLENLRLRLEALAVGLAQAAERGRGLDQCWKRCQELEQRLSDVLEAEAGDWICWYEVYRRSFTLHRTPVDVANDFRRFLESQDMAWVFTSATLAVAGSFQHFAASLGLETAETHCWESPFDYAAQSLFYHPRDLPMPSAPHFTAAVVEAALPVLELSRGRAFFLFTSHKALRQAAELMQGRLPYPLLVQGAEPKAALVERFKRHGHAILMGTASFWEGVDVRGPALSCVIIDKLPFASPGDPVLSAHLDSLRQRGADPFATFQLPAAVIALKQGIGRLIRDFDDRGLLMLCDPRLLKKRYGQVFLDSVPAMKRTRSLEDVEAFFAEEPG